MKKYIKNIIFTETPLSGKFRYGNEFQIYPLTSDKAPYSKQSNHYPVIIEFTIEDNSKTVVDWGLDEIDTSTILSETIDITNKVIFLTNLLTSITNHRFFFYKNPANMWSFPIPDELDDTVDYNESISAWSMSIFYFPKMNEELKITEFSEVELPDIELVEHRKYYMDDPVDSKEKKITFPNTIQAILSEYFLSTDKLRKVLDSTCLLISNGIELRNNMKSLSFISLVSSIETLIHYHNKKEKIEFECHACRRVGKSKYHCQKCDKPIWGIAAQFRQFLHEHVSKHDDAMKKYRKIYGLRSKIAHTDYLISGDKFIDWSDRDRTDELFKMQIETIQISRLSLVNWILTNKPASNSL